MINAYAALEAGGELKPFSYDPGALKSDQIEIEVSSCGLCHSDLSMINNDWGISQYPLVAGHEIVGTVAQMGNDVVGFELGQRVGLGWHAAFCNHCVDCKNGDHNLCSQGQGTIVGRHGGFADKVRAQASAVVALPESLNGISAGPLFCGGITVFNPLVQFDVKPTDKVGVIGIGGLGHMALKFLNAWGCEVTAFTSSASKHDQLSEMGAHHVLNSRDSEAIQSAARSFDLLISTVNVSLDWATYLGTLKPRGRLHLVGATLEPLDISVMHLMSAQRSISSSPVGSPATIAKMLDFSALHQVEPVIETFPMAKINDAIAHLASGKAHYRVVLTR